MSSEEDLEFLKRRAQFLSQRSLLELELVLMEALRKELPGRIEVEDEKWLRELVKILELDDYLLLDAVLGNYELGVDFDPEIIETLQSYLPGRGMKR